MTSLFSESPRRSFVSPERGATLECGVEAREYTLHEVDIVDPYVNPETKASTDELVAHFEAMGFYGDASIDLDRTRRRIDKQNPPTAKIIELVPDLERWFKDVPTAKALDPMYDPYKRTFSNGDSYGPELMELFCNIDDAIGIRSRAEIVRRIMIEETLASDEQVAYLSLASGAAQSIIATAASIKELGGKTPDVTLVDAHRPSLALGEQYAERAGIADHVRTERFNILNPNGIAHARQPARSALESPSPLGLEALAARGLMQQDKVESLPEASYKFVEIIGLFEYIGREDQGNYQYDKVLESEERTAGAETLLRNAYELVEPGGTLVLANMLDTHPQLGFTLNVVQWPHIIPRSIEEMIDIIDASGIEGALDVHTAPDGAYAVYSLRKSA